MMGSPLPRLVETLNSTYEIDQEKNRVRRVRGTHPVDRKIFKADGEWVDFYYAYLRNNRLIIQWHYDKEMATRTSEIINTVYDEEDEEEDVGECSTTVDLEEIIHLK